MQQLKPWSCAIKHFQKSFQPAITCHMGYLIALSSTQHSMSELTILSQGLIKQKL